MLYEVITRALPGGAACGCRELERGTNFQRSRVITSYSIHYTKLYECKLLCTGKRLEFAHDVEFFWGWFYEGHVAGFGIAVQHIVGHNHAANRHASVGIFRFV